MRRNGILLITLFFCPGVIFAQINPNALRHYTEGMNYYNRNDFDSAIVEYSNAIAIYPEYADAYLERGNCYDNKDDQIGALENYLKAGEYEKKYIIFAYAYECASDNVANYDEAIIAFTQCINQGINLLVSYCMRGNSYIAKYDFANAYADYTEAIRISPNIYQPYVSRGFLNIVMDNNKQAISDLEMSIQLSQQFAIVFFYLSILYESEGNSVKAKEMMNIYINMENLLPRRGNFY